MLIKSRPSHLPLEFVYMPKRGKHFMPKDSKVRALQSRISIKFPLASAEKVVKKEAPKIKQSVIDDFEKAYARITNMDKQRLKNRNVS